MLAMYVFRVLAAQRGFDAVKGFDQAAFSEGTDDRRRSMIEQVKSKATVKKRVASRGPWGAAAGGPVNPAGQQLWSMQQHGVVYNQGAFVAGPAQPGWAGVPQAWTPMQGISGVPGAVGPSVVSAAVAPSGVPCTVNLPGMAAAGQMTGQGGSFAVPQGVCRRCFQPGHYATHCPVVLKCWTCGLEGYTKNTCPQCRGRVASSGQ
jgi:hypothetical protein